METAVKQKKIRMWAWLLSAFILGNAAGIASFKHFIYDRDIVNVQPFPDDDNVLEEMPYDSELCILVNKENKLDSSYVPDDLKNVNIPFVFKGTSDQTKMKGEAAEAMEKMISDAKAKGVIIKGVSGYRSYSSQKAIYNNALKTKGKAHADKYNAEAGASEHQTGLAMDLTADSAKDDLIEAFADTKEGLWLDANCYKYGFIIRYDDGKENITGYSYEPWHVRYVGIEAAKEMHDEDITLEEYIDKNKESGQ